MSLHLLKQISKERRTMVTGIILSVVAALSVWCYIFGWQGKELVRLQNDWSEKRRQASLKDQRDPTQIFKKGGEDLKILMSGVPAKYEFPRVLGQLMDIASASQVVLGGISYKPQKTSVEGLLPFGLQFTVNGNYPSLKRFLASTHQIDGLAYVETVSLSNTDPFDDKANMDVQLIIHLKDGVRQ